LKATQEYLVEASHSEPQTLQAKWLQLLAPQRSPG